MTTLTKGHQRTIAARLRKFKRMDSTLDVLASEGLFPSERQVRAIAKERGLTITRRPRAPKIQEVPTYA